MNRFNNVGRPVIPAKPMIKDEDDWETDPDFVNDLSEKESRWGAKTVEGSGRLDTFDVSQLRDEVVQADEIIKQKQYEAMPKASDGYGGKFGIQKDRVDNCAVDFSYDGKVEAHVSQKDYKTGFGGKFGIQKDRQDKSAASWNEKIEVPKHESQKDYKHGFGGKFGIQKDRQDKSAVGWDSKEQLQSHESQKDYKKGFGGQFGVQSDRQDKCAVGWDTNEKVEAHESQKDYKKGFGGQFGVQKDRQDKSAVGWDSHEKLHSHESQKDYKKGFGGQFGVQKDRQDKSAVGWECNQKVEFHESQKDYKKGFEPPARPGGISSLKSKFEQFQMGSNNGDDKVAQERERRKLEDEALRKREKEMAAERKAKESKNGSISVKVDNDQNILPNNFKSYKAPEVMISPTQNCTSSISTVSKTQETFNQNNTYLNNTSKPPKEESIDNHTFSPVEQEQSYVPPPAPGGNEILINSLPKRHTTDSFDQVSNDEDEWNDENTQSLITKVQPPASYSTIEDNSIKEQIYNIDPPPPEASFENEINAVALFEYEKQDDDEIGFDVDDIITNIEKVDVGWWRGTCKGQTGLFPANYVKEK
ncbi:Cortactin [Strongyloides ratti]|uniref:Cortactin n=1 Tax=Strongyloides ratti TaxID=34506 RepID=A0A090LT23_STRRB|nr:Cortactin [Strongyloides ratti]CEF70734.1 Cortactin [Strongyloides ratti]